MLLLSPSEVTTVNKVALIAALLFLSGCATQTGTTTAKPEVAHQLTQNAQSVTPKATEEPVLANSEPTGHVPIR